MKKAFRFFNVAIAFFLTIFFVSCSNSEAKDADIKAEAEKALKADPANADVKVEVNECVVTLSGSCVNQKAKDDLTMKMETVPHVKSVVNNCVVPEREMTDDELNKSLYDISKDISTIKIGSMNGVVAVAGNLSKAEWDKLKADIDRLKPKGYDTASLIIAK